LDFFAAIAVFVLFLLIIWKTKLFSIHNINKKTIIVAALFKLVMTVVFFLVYTYHYSNRTETDMYRYFDDAKIMYGAAYDCPSDFVKMISGIGDASDRIEQSYYMQMNTWHKSFDYFVRNDNRTMVRVNALFMLFTFGSFYANMILFTILGFIGLFFIFKSLQFNDPLKDKLLFLLLMFFPSLVFWTSGISKEAILMFGLGGFIFFIRKLSFKPLKIMPILWLSLFFYILISMKIYVLICLFPVLLAVLLAGKADGVKGLLKFSIFVIAFIALLWNFHHIIPQMNFLESFVRKQHDFIHYSRFINAGSLVTERMLSPTFFAFLSFVPLAFANVLFRPLFFDADNIFMFMVSIENLFLIVSIAFLALRLSSSKFKANKMFWANVFFALFFFALIGIATPVLGAIVRYKIVAYPFMFAACIALIDNEKLKKYFPFLLKN